MIQGLFAGLGAVYSVGRLVDETRYWYDYHQRTGIWPRYPFRTTRFGSGLSSVNGSFRNLKRL